MADAIHEESDVENDSASPIFDRFYANGGLHIVGNVQLQIVNSIVCETLAAEHFKGKK